jgi:hypothetical protein
MDDSATPASHVPAAEVDFLDHRRPRERRINPGPKP